MLSTKVANQQKAKVQSRSVIQASSGPLTAADTQKRKEQKAQKQKEQAERSENHKARVVKNKVKRDFHARGVIAWKAETFRKKQVKGLQQAKHEVPIELLQPIIDPEKTAKEEDIQEEADSQLISTIGQLYDESEGDVEADFISFSGLDKDLDFDNNIDPGLF